MRRNARALPILLLLGCPSSGPSPKPEAVAEADGKAAALGGAADAASPAPAPSADDPIARARSLLALSGPTMSAKVPWRDENRIRLMSRLAKVGAGAVDSMIASLPAVDNDGVAEAFQEQLAERWHDMAGCTVAASPGSRPTLPGPEIMAKLPAEFGAIAARLESATFFEIRCDADGRTFLLGLDADGIVSARDTTPKGAGSAPPPAH